MSLLVLILVVFGVAEVLLWRWLSIYAVNLTRFRRYQDDSPIILLLSYLLSSCLLLFVFQRIPNVIRTYNITIHNSRLRPCGIGRGVQRGSFVIEDIPAVVEYQAEFVFCPVWYSPTFEPLVPDRLVQGEIPVQLLGASVGVASGYYPLARFNSLSHRLTGLWLVLLASRVSLSVEELRVARRLLRDGLL